MASVCCYWQKQEQKKKKKQEKKLVVCVSRGAQTREQTNTHTHTSTFDSTTSKTTEVEVVCAQVKVFWREPLVLASKHTIERQTHKQSKCSSEVCERSKERQRAVDWVAVKVQ